MVIPITVGIAALVVPAPALPPSHRERPHAGHDRGAARLRADVAGLPRPDLVNPIIVDFLRARART